MPNGGGSIVFWEACLFFAGCVKRKDPPAPTNMDHGFLAHRRKEGALLVHMVASWRARACGRPHILNNHDLSNAFASTLWDNLDAANLQIVRGEDAAIGKQRYRWATVQLPVGVGKTYTVKTQLGGGG